MKIYSKLLLLTVSIIFFQCSNSEQTNKQDTNKIKTFEQTDDSAEVSVEISKNIDKNTILLSPVELILSEYESHPQKDNFDTIPKEIFYTKSGNYLALYELINLFEEGESVNYQCILCVNSDYKATDILKFESVSDAYVSETILPVFTDNDVYVYHETEITDVENEEAGEVKTETEFLKYPVSNEGKFSEVQKSETEFRFATPSNEDDIKTIKKLFVICENQKMQREVNQEDDTVYEYFYGHHT